jgi:ribosomal protein S13
MDIKRLMDIAAMRSVIVALPVRGHEPTQNARTRKTTRATIAKKKALARSSGVCL